MVVKETTPIDSTCSSFLQKHQKKKERKEAGTVLVIVECRRHFQDGHKREWLYSLTNPSSRLTARDFWILAWSFFEAII